MQCLHSVFLAKVKGQWNSTYSPEKRPMRQNINKEEMYFHDNGNVYITNSEILFSKNCRIGNNPCVFETDKYQGLQIDNEFDFKICESVVENRSVL